MEASLRFILRIIGTSSLFAVLFVAVPYSWMDSIHAYLGMGKLPDQPVVGYLARSVSAFYALLGGLFWVLSFDLIRHRYVLNYMGGALIVFGLALLAIDWWEGLPFYWKVWEGPFVTLLGVAVLLLNRAVQRRAA